MRRHHDVGGLPDEPIDFSEHDHQPWEKLVTALWGAIRARGVSNLDEMRRLVEDLPPHLQDRGYTHSRAEALVNVLDERGLITRAQVEARMAQIKARLEAGS